MKASATAVRILACVLLPLTVGGLSGWATSDGVASWYPTLIKPSFNPPSWVFGPVWTVLYIAMGIALFLVLRTGRTAPTRRDEVASATRLFLLQLGLNGLWSLLFFGLQRPGWALVEILVLWCAIAWTIHRFRTLSHAAALLLLPYLAWVSFATVLNGALWWLNR